MSADFTFEEIDGFIEEAHYCDKNAIQMQMKGSTFEAVLTLAKRGLATMPRPISEAPNGESILVRYDDGSSCLIAAADNVHVWKPYSGAKKSWLVVPVSFIPLSALETP